MGGKESQSTSALYAARSLPARSNADHRARGIFRSIVGLQGHDTTLDWATLLTSNRRKQYTRKLKEWGYEKNVKDKDMAAIVRKDLKRRAEDPHRPSAFRLRGRPVTEQKIERYKSSRGISDGSAFEANAGISFNFTCLFLS